jgi:glycosyltransferase involved in cell wall biosynthesis
MDVIHERCRRFEEAGLTHWLRISAEEETAALSHFDTIVAIQSSEAATLKRMLPDKTVIVCGMAVDHVPEVPQPSLSDEVRVGFLAGAGDQNRVALKQLLDCVWPGVIAGCTRPPTLHLAGQICDQLPPDWLTPKHVVVDGPIVSLADWYRGLDLVVNPVEVGSGLKIKTIEALAFGRCLIATPAALDGIDHLPNDAVVQVDGDNEFTKAIVSVVEDAGQRHEIGSKAAAYARNCLHPARVYHDLLESLSVDCEVV